MLPELAPSPKLAVRAWPKTLRVFYVLGLVLQLSLLVDQEFGGLSFPVAGFGDGLMDPAPERPSENEVDAEAGAQLEAGDEAADLGHAEGNECARSSAPFWPARLTRIAARGRFKLFGIVTNRTLPGDQVIWWLRGRCGKSEEVHAVMKADPAGGRMPSGLFGANAAWLMILAHNLNAVMKRLVLGPAWCA